MNDLRDPNRSILPDLKFSIYIHIKNWIGQDQRFLEDTSFVGLWLLKSYSPKHPRNLWETTSGDYRVLKDYTTPGENDGRILYGSRDEVVKCHAVEKDRPVTSRRKNPPQRRRRRDVKRSDSRLSHYERERRSNICRGRSERENLKRSPLSPWSETWRAWGPLCPVRRHHPSY